MAADEWRQKKNLVSGSYLAVLQIKCIGHGHENCDVDDGQTASDFYIVFGTVFSRPHVQRVDLVGGQDEGVGNADAHNDGGHARVDADLGGEGNAQRNQQGAGAHIGYYHGETATQHGQND